MMTYDGLTMNFTFFSNEFNYFLECVISLAFVKQQLSGRIQSLQVDLDPCHPWYTGYTLAPHKTQKMQSGPTERQGSDGIDLCK